MGHDTNKSVDEVCEALDNLYIQNLELLEEKVLVNIQLENALRQGHIDLAKARYIQGNKTVGLLQIPSEDNDVKPLFELETSYSKSEKHPEMKEKFPSFDISLKKFDKDEEAPRNPLKWFGVLVPQSLRTAQKHFQDAIYLSVKLANIQAELDKSKRETDYLKKLKAA